MRWSRDAYILVYHPRAPVLSRGPRGGLYIALQEKEWHIPIPAKAAEELGRGG